MDRTAFASDKRVVLRVTTKQALATLENAELDAVYIDGDHTLKGITIDLISLYDIIKSRGYILGDDFVPNIWRVLRWAEVMSGASPVPPIHRASAGAAAAATAESAMTRKP